ncbi:hypothetical protein AMELA_G00267880 [Ameiurus melas]|uniref:Uncharacterized protein n=1 Tax=Ameiurus melas TaxID=219545 RepID=A0A7J5ZRM7_AMEME|nr:hypothetical protein AMELA_G00267880 [Ameiurus melas]
MIFQHVLLVPVQDADLNQLFQTILRRHRVLGRLPTGGADEVYPDDVSTPSSTG